MMIIPPCFKLY
jgi:hypothetical protein